MVRVRIYQPAKTAMQSGKGNTRQWVLEFEPTERPLNDALMGWVGSGDVNRQIRLSFASKAEALAYAKRKGYVAQVRDPQVRSPQPKSYADNFAFQKIS
ncbi:ETC complex I subunit [Pararhodospirillum photometricum]|uniref:ETC complex I subunit conserved region n=1 Tax=Pararhodospirillum photometricum DSM 122 TaxID=1150469 RepID=H6SK66_PARPM|nr:ETC complex I subunit [Pararhodospirillum photometricum]CCG08381.1 ETC complex I subunit conserved region [Pararhodospirillum photometricum DSM 122]